MTTFQIYLPTASFLESDVVIRIHIFVSAENDVVANGIYYIAELYEYHKASPIYLLVDEATYEFFRPPIENKMGASAFVYIYLHFQPVSILTNISNT